MQSDKIPLVLAIIGLMMLTAPLDVVQLIFALVGALLYAVTNVLPNVRRQKYVAKIPKAKQFESNHSSEGSPTTSHSPKPTAMPIKAPVFDAATFDEQVDELIERIAPKASCHKAVEELTAIVRKKIQSIIPEVEVMGFATGDLRGGTAYGVAVPEVDIVANANPEDLTRRLQGRLTQNSRQRSFAISRLDSRKLQKSAIRVCTSLLVSVGLKFRRSSFKSEEPKVTLLAPASLGIYNMAIPIDFSVNNTTPLYNMALLTECGQMDARAKSLILLVRRWAKDRGVCHASKGHLPPYAWSLLVIYYLQVGVEAGDGNLPLPPLEAFAVSSGLMKVDEQTSLSPKSVSTTETPKSKASSGRQAVLMHPEQKSVGELFKGFVRFYNIHFDWRKEAISVRSGKRAAPNLALDIHIVIHSDGQTAVSPTVEDPFETHRNLGNCTNSASLKRFLEEFERADDLLSNGTTLTKILEPWRPPEHSGDKDEGDNDEEFSFET
eukprot:CAMPEP_0169117820 /NCGR_PEP_ID=MMETSP1015-20121227/30668_1 /TAXON_ID=342587 /ORGANISM="Karlodinium micrum, Strain CCMP2283" /LENGTH=492 /DNA_ID=CAMNT_0009180541 /DNA_START=232 /DNA_END=1710 /DNA_ORIENTATION=-